MSPTVEVLVLVLGRLSWQFSLILFEKGMLGTPNIQHQQAWFEGLCGIGGSSSQASRMHSPKGFIEVNSIYVGPKKIPRQVP